MNYLCLTNYILHEFDETVSVGRSNEAIPPEADSISIRPRAQGAELHPMTWEQKKSAKVLMF